MKRKPRIGIYSAAVDNDAVVDVAKRLGKLIAKEGWSVVTGGCNGIPNIVAKAAHEHGAQTYGFSPCTSMEEHIKESLPHHNFSKLIFVPNDYENKDKIKVTRKYRNVESCAFVDAAIFINGRCGSLNEFTNCYDMDKVIGVMKGTGGISDHVPELIKVMNKQTGATIYYEESPETIIAQFKKHFSQDKLQDNEMVVNSMNLADQILNKVDEKKNPSIVGLDPQYDKIPEFIKRPLVEQYGPTLKAVGKAIVAFNKKIIDEVHDIVGFVKPQTAFYEKIGPEGAIALSETIQYAKSKGLIVILDAKRNDIGSTASAYAQAYLGGTPVLGDEKPMQVDMITVTPYLGSDGVRPFLGPCANNNKGIFVLVKTSNPSAGELQDKKVNDAPIHNMMATHVHEWGKELIGKRGYTPIGAVVGATYPEDAQTLRRLMPNSIFLVPGYGKQGGTAEDVIPCFNEDGYGALVNSSRGIIFNYADPTVSEQEFRESVRNAALQMRSDIVGALRKARPNMKW